MKKKNIYFLIPMVILIIGFIIIKSFDDKSFANGENIIPEGTRYNLGFKNMYSHYEVSVNNDGGISPVGTKYLYSSEYDSHVVVYCAERGVELAGVVLRYHIDSEELKKSYKFNNDETVAKSIRDNLKMMMIYAYPYVQLTDLKEILKDSKIGLDEGQYESLEFDKLNAQEAITAVQASLWNIRRNQKLHGFKKLITTDEVNNGSGTSGINTLRHFRTCEQYYKTAYNVTTSSDLIRLTFEERKWYEEDGCDVNGKFYNNVYKLNDFDYQNNTEGSTEEQEKVKNRVNALIDWYSVNLLTKLKENNVPERVKENISILSKKYYYVDGKLNLDVTFNTNMSSYSVIFKDKDGNALLETDNLNGNTFTLTNLSNSTTNVVAKIISNNHNGEVYYYYVKNGEDSNGQETGQDYIGVDYYTTQLDILNDEVVEEGKIAIYKVDSETDKIEISYDKSEVDNTMCGQGGCLVDAEFALYDANKNLIKQNIKTTNSAIVLTNIEIGNYYLKEINPPKGYNISNFNSSLIDQDGFIKFEVKANSLTSIVISNKKNKICFLKVDKNDSTKILGGSEFEIKDINGNIVETFVTKDNESTCFEGKLANGTYYLYEKTPPVNYLKVYDVYKFTIGSNQNIPTDNITLLEPVNGVITITNIPGVGVSKSDITTGACVSGAELTVKDKDGKVIDKWISSCENGRENHILTLEPGPYTLIESGAPLGYATAESIEFTIDSDGKVDKQLNMKDSPIDVCILKISKDKKTGLSGAKFEIYDANGNLYETFTSGSTCTSFKYMPVGEYTLKEIKAPDGYKLNEQEIKITIKDTRNVQIFEIENEIEVPKTAMDYSKIILIIAVLFMSLGLVFVFYYSYKKRV